MGDVEVHDLCRRHACAESERDQAAGRSPDDQIEVLGNLHCVIRLDLGKYRGREQALQTTSIETEDLQRAVERCIYRLRVAVRVARVGGVRHHPTLVMCNPGAG